MKWGIIIGDNFKGDLTESQMQVAVKGAISAGSGISVFPIADGSKFDHKKYQENVKLLFEALTEAP